MFEALTLMCWIVVADNSDAEKRHIIGVHNISHILDRGSHRRIILPNYFIYTNNTTGELVDMIEEECEISENS